METMIQNLKYSGGFRFMIHEDVCNKIESEKLLAWVKSTGSFKKIFVSDPPKKQGHSIHKLLQESESKFIVRSEDDWILYRPINLDPYVKAMEENPEINQINFMRICQTNNMYGKEVVYKSGVALVPTNKWFLILA